MSIRYFGYIEGYYGRMLTWDERKSLIDHCQRLHLNTYLYAPKEDAFHRQQWRKAYPAAWQSAFKSFVAYAQKQNVSVVPGIAPGLSFDYCSAADYTALLNKCLTFAKLGTQTICLLMDDIAAVLPESCKKRFSSLGQAHGKLLTRLHKDLTSALDSSAFLWFCPTVYASELIGQTSESSLYLPDLAANMPHSTVVFWTGDNVISKTISAKSLHKVNTLFKGALCIWDNLYANDYCPNKLFIGPYKNRSRNILKSSRGVLLNPTGLINTDALLLSLLAAYKNAAQPQSAWQTVFSKLPFAKEIKVIAPFFDLPFSKLSKALSASRIKQCKAALKKLIWEWKSPLQREWYPYLYMLDCNLTLCENDPQVATKTWISKKYPSVVAAVLNKK